MTALVSSLQKLRKTLALDSKPLVEAEAPASAPAIDTAFYDYVTGVVDVAVESYDVDFDTALGRFFEIAEGLEEDEMLMPMPDAEDTSPENIKRLAEWLGAAATIQLGQLVLASLEAEAADEE